jgi:hypothetical protein
MSGRFSDAELAYEELLKDFPFDQRYHFTEFCLAKSIFAQKAKGDIFGAMYCFVLCENSQAEEMKKVAWETLLASISEENTLTRNDLYWLLQIANILNDFCPPECESEIEVLSTLIKKLKAFSPDSI